ncbi:MAG: 4a-hydroxytetrahydrobiopterin dehydratase [Gammaproteobacteria bacterium]|nr:4a-hydroxytetrahydrobiopterin dehydratase [Gammaproteobacteria bacterium]
MCNRMDQQEIEKQLQVLNSKINNKWLLSNDRIKKEFKFRDFNEALNFMVRVGRHAEDLDHHPDWCNVYDIVSIELTTHSAKGITELDLSLASRIEEESILARP